MSNSCVLAIPATFALAIAAFGQPGAIPTPVAAPIDSYQVGYAANLNVADSVINVTNTGTLLLPTGLTTTGNMCVNVYAFDATQTMIACCSCLVQPNVTNSLSVQNDIALPAASRRSAPVTSMTIKLLATTPLGLSAVGSGVTEHSFLSSTLSPAELTKLTQFCNFIQTNGNGVGICNSCTPGAR